MAGHGVDDNPNLKGLARLFNGETNRGRGNVSYFAAPKGVKVLQGVFNRLFDEFSVRQSNLRRPRSGLHLPCIETKEGCTSEKIIINYLIAM